jgi:hypothetical protein
MGGKRKKIKKNYVRNQKKRMKKNKENGRLAEK